MEDDDATTVVAKPRAARTSHDDIAQMPGGITEQASHFACVPACVQGPEQHLRDRLKVHRNAVAFQTHEMFALLQCAVFDGAEDGENELRQLASSVLGMASLLVDHAYQSRRGLDRDVPLVGEARGKALKFEGKRIALFLRREWSIGIVGGNGGDFHG